MVRSSGLKNLRHQVRRAVHDEMLLREAVLRSNDSKKLDNLLNAVKISELGFEGGDDVQRAVTRSLLALRDRKTASAESPGNHRAILLDRMMTGHVHDGRALPRNEVVIRLRRPWWRQLDALGRQPRLRLDETSQTAEHREIIS